MQSSNQNHNTLTVVSTTLYAGVTAGGGAWPNISATSATMNFTFALNNHGSTTFITSLVIFAEGTTYGAGSWDNTSALTTEKNFITLTH